MYQKKYFKYKKKYLNLKKNINIKNQKGGEDNFTNPYENLKFMEKEDCYR